ncbi:hypothetical protein HHK36_020521 [Tetracentron sinense]|uniref:Uncharacterized protein n=1 Tax=Tetracentron sinense TaxID=13715 RepID=A0A834YRR3_TETSI|nr:hypothetical protein HHK36_020521 [Tetracentron sinense]
MTVSSSPIWAFPASSTTLSLNLPTLAALKIEPWVPSVRLFSSPTASSKALVGLYVRLWKYRHRSNGSRKVSFASTGISSVVIAYVMSIVFVGIKILTYLR